MYKIIGADGHEYGPVTAEQLQQWIREGRATGQTKVQPEGSPEWKTLAELPEFADIFRVVGGSPVVPPVVGAVDPDALAAQILARDYTIDIGRCIGRAWEVVKKDFWLLVCASFVGGLIASGCCIPYLGIIIALVVGGPMMGGLYALYLKKIRGQPAQFSDAFLGFSTAFVPLMLAKIVVGLLTGLGMVLCILPGIYLGVAWVFALPLVIDKKMDFWPAMELSRKVVSKHWWVMFGFLLVSILVALAGLLACCVGVFVSMAIIGVALMYAYEDVFGAQSTPQNQ
jgi:uncharacterized protein DUF4339